MKHSLKILVGSLAIAALTACGGGGGGSSDPGAAAGIGIAGINGTQGYLGKGDWNGNLVGQNTTTQQYQMFMYQYSGGGQFTTLMAMRIWSGYRGMLPEQMGFSINNRRLGGDGFINGNGFLINNYNYGGYSNTSYYPGQVYPGQVYGQQPAYPGQAYYPGQVNPIAQGTPVIQITAQFTDVCRLTMQVQVRYQNVIVLAGPMTGTVQFSQQYAQGGYPYGTGYPGTVGYPGYTPIPGQAVIPAQCYMNQQQVAQPQYQQQYW